MFGRVAGRLVLAALLGAIPSAVLGQSADHVVVVLDDSGSMGDRMRRQSGVTRMQAAKQALNTVLASLDTSAQVGIVRLNGDPSWVVPMGAVDFDRTRDAIARIVPKGGTPLGAFMKVGADALLEARARDHYGTYRLLLVTDGEAGDARVVRRYLPDVLSRGITVDVIGVDMASDHSLATQVHSYRRADDPDSLTAAIQEVFAETRAADAGASDVSDFELIAALPDACAQAALVALAEAGNHPIGSRAADNASQAGDDGEPLAHSPGSSGNGVSVLGLVVLMMVVLVFAVLAGLVRTAVRILKD